MVNHYKEWRARLAAERAQPMDADALARRYWIIHDGRRWDRFFMVLMVVGGCLFYWSSAANDDAIKRQQDRNEEVVNQIIATRTEARRTQCLRDNEVRHDAGEAAAKKARDFIDSSKAYSGAGPSEGALKEAEDAYVESQRRVTLESYPHRDCSDDGIVAYYKNPPAPQGGEACVPDHMGLCK